MMKKIGSLLFLMITFVAPFIISPASEASTFSREPILRINAPTHVASIRKIATDGLGEYLATASYDKTVKVWDSLTGDLITTLRPPIGDGNEGKLFAVAISPDGHNVACGGFTGKQWDNNFSIYIFDIQTGEIIRRLSGLPHAVLDLRYSPDGKYLAVGFARGNGIRIYNASDYSILFEDFQYKGSVYSLAFDSSNRLVSVSDAGYIRLYSSQPALLKKSRTPGGRVPFSVDITPDGSLIAVGYFDSRRVDVLSGTTLKLLYRPSTKGIRNGNLSSVAWVSSGSYLCAAGRWSSKKDSNPIRCWSKKGKGRYKDLFTPNIDTVLDLQPLPGTNKVAFCSGDPALGLFSTEGNIIFYKKPLALNFRHNQKLLLVNNNGSKIGFNFQENSISHNAIFSIEDRYLELDSPEQNSLTPPRQTGLPVRKWKGGKPTFRGRPIKLAPRERAYSLAILPDKSGFILGCSWSLRFFDSSGKLVWKTTSPATVRAVNVTRDKRIVVAAYADGTIRWHRLRDGKEILSLFPIPSDNLWVIWSPSGYYDTSIGAEDIIGWHVNRDTNKAADFFPIGRFRSVYYRPDIIIAILRTLDEKEALAYAAQQWGRKSSTVEPEKILPPVVKIVNLPKEWTTDSNRAHIKFSLRSSAPVTSFKILIDGRPFLIREGSWDASSNDLIQEVDVELPPGDCILSVIATNKYASSEPAIVKIHREVIKAKTETQQVGGGAVITEAKARAVDKAPTTPPPPAPATTGFALKPNLYVLAIGVSKYAKSDMSLIFPAKDAQDFAHAMETQQGGLYNEVKTLIITNENATKDKILEGLDWIRKQTTPKDVAMIFIAGHGMTDNRSGTYYFLPYDANPEKLMATAVPAYYIRDTVASLQGKVLLFMDACYSGNILKGKRTRGIPVAATSDVRGFVNELISAENGAIVFASSAQGQRSLEADEWGNGAFTKALLEGLSGKADPYHQGKITPSMLYYFIAEQVKKLTNGEQTPLMDKPPTVPEFPIAVVKKG